MKKITFIVFLTVAAGVTHAQFLKNLKTKAKVAMDNSINRSTDKVVDKTINSPVDTVTDRTINKVGQTVHSVFKKKNRKKTDEPVPVPVTDSAAVKPQVTQ